MKEFQKRYHEILDTVIIPLILINHDESSPVEIRSAVCDYIERLQKILEPVTETENQAKMHAWNVIDWMIEDYGRFMPLMTTLHPTHFRLKHAAYHLIKEFQFQDITPDVMEALESNELMYLKDYKDLDGRIYQQMTRE